MNTFTVGQEVKVTIAGARWGKEDAVFVSTVTDVLDNGKYDGVWVDHPECRGEDMLFVSLDLDGNKVEAVATVERWSSKDIEMKEAKKVLQKAFKWVEEDIKVFVKVYDCFENDSRLGEQFNDQQSYDVEISYAIGEDIYTDCVVTDSFYSTVEGDEVAEKQAVTRAKAVLRTVKGWFSNDDQITVIDGIEVYHA